MNASVRLLRMMIHMRVADVRENPKGIVLVLGPAGFMHPTRTLLIEGTISELHPPRGRVIDDDDEISGDDIHEQSRYIEEET